MSLSGLGVVAIWHDLMPEAKDEFYEWHAREHMPERLGIPGFRRGRRFIAQHGTPEYFNLYEADSPQVLSGPDYLQRLNAPTPWTRQVVASFRNVARAVGSVLYSSGTGQGASMLTLRFDVGAHSRGEVADLLRQRMLPAAAEARGVSAVHLCRADDAGSRIETAEKKARAEGTVIPQWVVMIEGISASCVDAAALPVRAALAAHGAVTDFDEATYLLQHQRGKMPCGDG